MAKTSREVTLPVPAPTAFQLARASGAELPGFRLSGEDASQLRLKFCRGFGWSNPIDVEVAVWESAPNQSRLRYDASILALADPFGFMSKNLERFEQHLGAHHQALLQGTAPPAPPKDKHSVKANVILIGGCLGVLLLVVVAALVLALLGSR